MSKKFLSLYESHFKKLQQGGILAGDFVVFRKDYKSLDCYKDLNPEIKKGIQDIIDSKLDLRVVLVKPMYPSRQPGNAQQTGVDFYADISPHYGGGRYGNTVVTVPSALLQVSTTYPNQNPLPDEFVRKNNITIKPEEVKRDGKDANLPKANTKLANAKEPYTANYMKGL